MFTFIINRFNKTHIVDFKNVQGKYRTLCGKIYFQKQNITTLGADNTFNGICQTCKKHYDDMYFSDLEEDIRIVRSKVDDSSFLAEYHQLNFLGPKAKYEIVWERSWGKLSKAKSILKNKSNKYYGK